MRTGLNLRGAEGVYGQEDREIEGTAADPVESARRRRHSGIRPKRRRTEEIRQSRTKDGTPHGRSENARGQEAEEGRRWGRQATPRPRRDPQDAKSRETSPPQDRCAYA